MSNIDNEIEKVSQKQISEIFALFGEKHFRKLEHDTIKKFANYHNQVIATGGGVVENPKSLELLRKNGVIFYLSAPTNELFKRVKKTTHRPLLQKENPQDTWTDTFKAKLGLE